MKNFMIALVVLIAIVILIAAIFGLSVISTKNTLVAMEEDVDAKWAQIDNQLKRRSDLIPNLLACVKGYMSHESEIYKQITEARAKVAGAQTSIKERSKAEGELSGALSRLLAFSENNPEIKSDKQMQGLLDELAGTENRLAVARKNYNDTVKVFNTKIKQIPGCFFGYTQREYFEVSDKDKEAPKVEF